MIRLSNIDRYYALKFRRTYVLKGVVAKKDLFPSNFPAGSSNSSVWRVPL